MKGDQKYFPVYDNDGNLMPNFIFVTNIESSDPRQIISGNEKVVRPRLADAEFFFNTDRKKRLEDHLPRLETVLFQISLASSLTSSKVFFPISRSRFFLAWSMLMNDVPILMSTTSPSSVLKDTLAAAAADPFCAIFISSGSERLSGSTQWSLTVASLVFSTYSTLTLAVSPSFKQNEYISVNGR